MAWEVDPFTATYNALWAGLEASSGFSQLVKPNNRIKYALPNARQPEKQQVGPSDVPEVRIVPAGGNAHPQNSSSSSIVRQAYQIQISTGQLRIDAPDGEIARGIFPVKWEIIRAIPRIYIAFDAVSFGTMNCTKRTLSWVHSDVPQSELDAARSLFGWSSFFTLTAELWFRTADLSW